MIFVPDAVQISISTGTVLDTEAITTRLMAGATAINKAAASASHAMCLKGAEVLTMGSLYLRRA